MVYALSIGLIKLPAYFHILSARAISCIRIVHPIKNLLHIFCVFSCFFLSLDFRCYFFLPLKLSFCYMCVIGYVHERPYEFYPLQKKYSLPQNQLNPAETVFNALFSSRILRKKLI